MIETVEQQRPDLEFILTKTAEKQLKTEKL